MTVTVTLRWVAASNAVVGSDYKIYSDVETAGLFVVLVTPDATDRGDGSYTPFTTTLNQGGSLSATATSITVTSGTNFSTGDYVVIDKEMIHLGTKATATFTGCERGVGGSIPRIHTDGSTVYAAHETADEVVTYGVDRYVIRYRIAHLLAGSEAVPVEVTAINPPNPPDTSFITLYGVRESETGGPKAGETATLTVTATNPFGFDTGESIYNTVQTDVTGADGFFYFWLRRDAVIDGRTVVRVAVGTTTWTVSTLPDAPFINFLDT